LCKAGHSKGKKKSDQANQAEEKAENVEFAGNASAFIPDHSSPTSALFVKASSDWTADTGASSHMTPHHHWFLSYQPYKVPVRLANGQMIYSAGVGTIRFKPEGKDIPNCLLEFERVLHVPNLRNNLLSILYLTRNKDYRVSSEGSKMFFYHNGGLLQSMATTHITRWCSRTNPVCWTYQHLSFGCHRHFAHLNFGDVQQLISKSLVSGLTIKSNMLPDPICEPCIAGKQHRVVNKSASHTTVPLGLIHSDLHGPLPVCTSEGYCYWITFIDDAHCLWTTIFLHNKSDALPAFKRYKAFVENHTGHKIKALRDDKGGEYMSNVFGDFLAAAGIARQHTVRNEPHQNGVAERANRTLEEGATAMLQESHLPVHSGAMQYLP
jgi:hypothetical protein